MITNTLTTVILQIGPNVGNYIMLGGMVLVFYLFFMRPQQKKQKDQKKFSEDLAKGDHVVTMGGIHGKILSVDDTTVTLEIDRGTKMMIERTSISLEASKKLVAAKD